MRLENERIELKVTYLQCLCPDSMLMIERGKPVVDRESDHEQKDTMIERSNPSSADSGRASSEIPEWLQEFKENVVDDEVPEHRYSHASSSHEASLEPTIKRT